jgi:hypothetical protein
VTDNRIILNARYALPTKRLAAEKVKQFLELPMTHSFRLDDLSVLPTGNYRTPQGIVLNRKYIAFLRELGDEMQLHFRSGEKIHPVIIYDGDTIIGALMPMAED